ncbi:hypothetical protein SEPCBS57363_001937 [Sporothrix epigloea]|uniref:Uncharacterized protein n=1 Tax=Sporothrix epigloea TaxID=1892477 RepID=A0ABP0DG53_9PEZI
MESGLVPLSFTHIAVAKTGIIRKTGHAIVVESLHFVTWLALLEVMDVAAVLVEALLVRQDKVFERTLLSVEDVEKPDFRTKRFQRSFIAISSNV